MGRWIFTSLLILVITFIALSFTLSNLQIKGRSLWCYLNTTIVLKGGQAYHMSSDLNKLQTGGADYLILGSSHAYKGYDPAHFEKQGIQIFNAGSDAQSLNCSYALLKHYRSKFDKLILDIFPASLCLPSNESQLTLLQSTPDANLAFQLFKLKVNIFTINNILYRLMRLNEKPLYEEEGTYMGRGYLMNEKVLTEKVAVPACEFDESQYDLLIQIIEYCQKEKIDITLVSHPLPLPEGKVVDYFIFKSRVDKICKDYQVSFYDYTYKYDLDNSYFMDYNHLNKKGVDFFNKKFIHDKFNKSAWN